MFIKNKNKSQSSYQYTESNRAKLYIFATSNFDSCELTMDVRQSTGLTAEGILISASVVSRRGTVQVQTLSIIFSTFS